MSNEVNTPFFIYCFCIFLVYFIKKTHYKRFKAIPPRTIDVHRAVLPFGEFPLDTDLQHPKSLIILFGLILNGLCCEVSLNHKRDLERDGMVKFSEVESGQLADLLKSVNESVSVNEQLT